MSAPAELIPDRGEAARSEEFFRCREFLDAEGVTHTLRIEAAGSVLLAPLVVREIPGTDLLDATSPYGYPGFAAAPPAGDFLQPEAGSESTAALDPREVDFSRAGLVSTFIRHTLGPPPLGGAAERSVVQVADPTLPRKSRASDRNRINRNRRRGYELRLIEGPRTGPADRAGFLAAYEQTMRRTAAADRYFFPVAYFDRVLESGRTWLALADGPDGEVAAASIVAESDGYLHYYLSGSLDSHLSDSPMKNVVSALVDLSVERGVPLNLGGGIARGDRLEEFKRGFANREIPWHTSELICDERAYQRLSAGNSSSSFFPAYRSS